MNWAEKLINIITPDSSLPIVVIDTQNFLRLPELQKTLRDKGYDIFFEKPGLDVRMCFEANCRGKSNVILVVEDEYEPLPDILVACEFKKIGAEKFFPNFAAEKICGLNFEQLCKLEELNPYEKLNGERTEKFIQENILQTQKTENQNCDNGKTIKELISKLQNDIQTISDDYKSWFALAPILGELGYMVYSSSVDYEAEYLQCLVSVNARFQKYVELRYWNNFSLAGNRWPVTIDKVQTYIHSAKNPKTALFVIDGMNLWQWYALKTELEKSVRFQDEKVTLSYLPSITAWARQSLFSGKKPDLCIDNSTEEKLFRQFWKNMAQFNDLQISYAKIAKQTDYRNLNLPNPDMKIAAFVDNSLDELMHGNILGNKQLFENTLLWIEKSHIVEYIEKLKNAGWTIFITTDHGNINANVAFLLQRHETTISKSRSKRYIEFVNKEQCENFVANHNDCKFGIARNCVYFTDDKAFSNTDKPDTKIITHGGSHIMELFVPIGVI